VGNAGLEHVGAHLRRAAEDLGLPVEFIDVREAYRGPWLAQKINWHCFGRRPTRLVPFSRRVVEQCRRVRPEMMLTTGFAPLDAESLEEIGDLRVYRVNYLTDDPWNPAQRTPWFLRAVRQYDEVFSTRRANLDDLRSLGCKRVGYLQFGFAPHVHFPEALSATRRGELESDVIFAGGGDADRVPYIAALAHAGFRVALYGGYWDRFRETRPLAQGLKEPAFLREAVAAAKVALCLVRRANRDGHCMRTFEVPAIGACMLVEKTPEHQELFGPDGRAVLYFDSIPEMVEKARWLLENELERNRLRETAHRLICDGDHTYRDRLLFMVKSAGVPVA
jgi:spore maturation protein CgeB